jgi:ABC-type multidrug transport system ATPase subunit
MTPDDADQDSVDAPRRERVVARASGLGLSFGALTVLADVDLDLAGGAVTAVVGANGSGKSTLLRALAGLLPPTTGQIEIASATGRAVGFCPQNPRFRGHFTVAETLSFYADLLDVDADVPATLELVGLESVADRRVDALSGGMTRLLGIAQAVLGDPGLLVLDEPASGLDPAIRAHVFDTLHEIADTGPAVVVATHHLFGAAGADRLLVIDQGDIAVDGPPDEVVADADAADLEAAFRAIVGDEPDVRAGVEVES